MRRRSPLPPIQYTRKPGGVTELSIVRRNGDRYTVKIDTADEPIVLKYRWHVIPLPGRVYCRTTQYDLHRQVYYLYLHRFLLDDQLHGDLEVYHVNQSGLDCRRENLRVLTREEITRMQTSRKSSNTGRRNIYYDERIEQYCVRFQFYSEDKSGSFDTLAEAIKWRDELLTARGYKVQGRRLVTV